jgi:hypothetical protein
MTQAPDMIQQAVNYCRHQAEKGLDSLAALMERTGADWQRNLEGMTEAQADFAPGKEWSAKEVAAHFLDVTGGVNVQIAKLTGGSLSSLEVDEGALEAAGKAPPPETVSEMRERLDTTFREIVALTRSLEGNENLDKQFPHPMFGQLTITEWIAFQRIHSMDHMQQIDKNKADAGYPR